MASEEHHAEAYTPLPDRAEAVTGEPAHERGAAIQHARGKLVEAVRAAEQHRHEQFESLREQMGLLDEEWVETLTAAWAEYDAKLAALGVPEKP
jgi:hypothetical protein